jgi:hypothetical protein
MKSTLILIAILLMALIGTVCWFTVFGATQQGKFGDVTILEGGGADGDLVIAGRSVNVQSEIKGDLAAAGSNVTTTEPVRGYLMVAGSNVNILGSVGNDLWAAGANVTVNAPVADNAMLAGRTVILQPEAIVKGDASIAGMSVDLLGRVERNLKLTAAKASFASEIGGSVDAHVRSLKLMPGAIIHGDLRVYGPNPPEISPEAKVLGSVDYQQEIVRRWSLMNVLGQWFFMFLALSILGAATIVLSTKWAQRIADKITRYPWPSLLTGFLGMILIPLICLLLAMTIIGIPLALVFFALYVVALLLSGVFVSYLVGGWLLNRMKRQESSPYIRLILGALVIALLASLPLIGWGFQLVILMTGLGALLLERRDSYQKIQPEVSY